MNAAPSKRLEAKYILAIAAPLIAAYLAEFAMNLTTKIIVGRLGYEELASIGMASDLFMELVIIIAGLLSVVGVLVAGAEGAGRKPDAGIAARQGLILATVFGIPGSILIWHLDTVLAMTGQDPKIIEIMGAYIRPVSFAVIPLLWFFVLRMFAASLAKTRCDHADRTGCRCNQLFPVSRPYHGKIWIAGNGCHGRRYRENNCDYPDADFVVRLYL